jgi:hypothetical protein
MRSRQVELFAVVQVERSRLVVDLNASSVCIHHGNATLHSIFRSTTGEEGKVCNGRRISATYHEPRFLSDLEIPAFLSLFLVYSIGVRRRRRYILPFVRIYGFLSSCLFFHRSHIYILIPAFLCALYTSRTYIPQFVPAHIDAYRYHLFST